MSHYEQAEDARHSEFPVNVPDVRQQSGSNGSGPLSDASAGLISGAIETADQVRKRLAARDQQLQKLPRHELLAALLEDGDFWYGLRLGYQAFQDRLYSEFHERRWTQNELISFVEQGISSRFYRREVYLSRLNDIPTRSYLYVLGFVLAYLNQALAARAERAERAEVQEAQAKKPRRNGKA